MAAAIAIVGWLAGPAQAAFPGRNGLLAVQPSTGGGLILVEPNGTGATRICEQQILCGIPAEPRWSPNGHAIAFVDAASSRVGVVAPDGTCLWCLLGPPLTTLRGTEPAFSSDGESLTVSGGRSGTPQGLWSVGLSSGAGANVITGAASDGVWSSTAELAIVRHGAVWVRRRGHNAHLRRLALGTEPSWSPDGSELVVVRGGWLWVLRARDGRGRRLVRGDDPAWSPDGRQIAYIGAGDAVRIAPVRGGRARSLAVQGRSLDWQPLSHAGSRSCSVPNSLEEVAGDAEAVIADSAGAWYGCLRAVGRWRPLLQATAQGDGYYTSVPSIRIAGRFALLYSTYSDKYGNCSETLTRYDLASGSSAPLASPPCGYMGAAPLTALSSPILGSSGFAAWKTSNAIPLYTSINSISCPSTSACEAVDAAGTVLSTSNPTGGRSAWATADIAGSTTLSSVSCPKAGFCVATNSSGGYAYTSTDPSGGPSAWDQVRVDSDEVPIFRGNYVSCPSASLCVIADDEGNIVTSTDPTGGSGTWTLVHVDTATPPPLNALACPSASLCVALDDAGNVITSTDPTGGASAWTIAHVNSGKTIPPASGISCPSTSLCVAVDGAGDLLTSTNPAGGASAWSLTQFGSASPVAVSCSSTSLCVAVDGAGDVLTSTDPTGGASTWQVANVDGTNNLTGISCPSAGECIAVDAKGNVLSSDAPTGGASAWSAAPVDLPDCAVQGTPCIVEHLYAHDDHGTQLVDDTPPGAGKALAGITLSGDGLVLSWSNDGLPRQASLG